MEGAIVSILNNFQLIFDNRQSTTDNFKLYILDNSPDGRYSHLVSSLGTRHLALGTIDYRYIPNRGFGASHNIALRETLSENHQLGTRNLALGTTGYHLVLNPDVRWTGDILSPMLEFMEQNPDVGLIAPKVLNPDGSLQYTARKLPSTIDLFANRFLPESLCKKRLDKYLMRNKDPDKPRNVPYLMGCFMLFRNSALKECGLFDERFFLYPEDIDITRRIHQKYKTLYWPSVSIIHDHSRASARSPRLFLIHLYNMALYFLKWK